MSFCKQKIIEQFKSINTWKKGDIRAPHKPLLILLALGELKNHNRWLSFADIEERLKNLIVDFGPSRQNIRPTYPFIRLLNDDIWITKFPNLIDSRKDYPRSYLVSRNIKAGFKEELIIPLKSDNELSSSIINHLLSTNFPESLHHEILNAVGLPEFGQKIISRNPRFREDILIAYQYKCAICDYSIRLANQLVGLEAAHIKWHQAGGPNHISNGIALCSLHHKLFDMGAFTLDENLKIYVSEKVNGKGIDEWLYRFQAKQISVPQKATYTPDSGYLDWHFREVFKNYQAK